MNSILVTGCNRGIGLGLIKVLVNSTKPLKHIIATCRNPEQALVNHKFAISFNFVPTLFLFLRWLGCFDFCEPTHSHTRNTTLTVLENQHFFFFHFIFREQKLTVQWDWCHFSLWENKKISVEFPRRNKLDNIVENENRIFVEIDVNAGQEQQGLLLVRLASVRLNTHTLDVNHL